MRKKYYVVKIIVFLCLVGIIWSLLSRVLTYSDDTHTKALFDDFYKLENNCVDVVWIGASPVQSGVIPSVIYDESGITEYSLATSSQPFCFTKFLIEETKKSQKPDLYFVDIRMLAYDQDVMGNPVLSENYIRRVTDNMEFSWNRTETILYMLEELKKDNLGEDYKLIDYLFPWTLYHSKWKTPASMQWGRDDDCYLGFYMYEKITAFDTKEVTSHLQIKEEEAISSQNEKYLEEFLDYCDENKVDVVFTHLPNCLNEEKVRNYNYVKAIIQKRGYQVIDFNEYSEKIGLNYETDFAEDMHMNINGAYKFSKFIANYLNEQYSFSKDKKINNLYTTTQARLERKLKEIKEVSDK